MVGHGHPCAGPLGAAGKAGLVQAVFPIHTGVINTRNFVIALVQAYVHRMGRTGRAKQAGTAINPVLNKP